ncbi:MAG TPA: STAS domain-containing protein, partial [Solirubrobacterales bacterium]|nr:STAS domain-containing protein [Solirubrobacterales bacterium]
MRSFRLVERIVEPNCCEIAVEGELEITVAQELRAALARAMREHERVLIDLRRCDFIDSTGIAFLVEAHAKAGGDGTGTRFALYGASGQVLRVLSITGLTDNGLVFESADQA